MVNNSVIFLKDWQPLIDGLSSDNRLYFWDLFSKYEYGKDHVCENSYVLPVWLFIKSQMDKMKDTYLNNTVKNNRENGKKGGRPKNTNNPMGLSETQITYKDKDKDKDKDNINEELWTSIKKNFLEDGSWHFKFCTEKDIPLEKLDKLLNDFIKDIELREDHKTLKELRSHFTNLYNSNKRKGINGNTHDSFKKTAPALRTADYYDKK